MIWPFLYLGTVVIVFLVSLRESYHHVPEIKYLSILLIIILLVEILGYYLPTKKINHQFLYHVYNPVEYSFLCYLYTSSFKNLSVKSFAFVSVVLFLLFCIWNLCFIQRNKPNRRQMRLWLNGH